MWAPNPFLVREKLGLLHFIYPMNRSHSAHLWISFKGNVSICGYRLGVSMGIDDLSFLYHHFKLANYIPILIFKK